MFFMEINKSIFAIFKSNHLKNGADVVSTSIFTSFFIWKKLLTGPRQAKQHVLGGCCSLAAPVGGSRAPGTEQKQAHLGPAHRNPDVSLGVSCSWRPAAASCHCRAFYRNWYSTRDSPGCVSVSVSFFSDISSWSSRQTVLWAAKINTPPRRLNEKKTTYLDAECV